MSEIRGRLTAVTRRQNSAFGNPQWELQIDGSGRPFKTAPDSQASFDVDPWHVGKNVVLTVDGRGEVVDYRLDGEVS